MRCMQMTSELQMKEKHTKTNLSDYQKYKRNKSRNV